MTLGQNNFKICNISVAHSIVVQQFEPSANRLTDSWRTGGSSLTCSAPRQPSSAWIWRDNIHPDPAVQGHRHDGQPEEKLIVQVLGLG